MTRSIVAPAGEGRSGIMTDRERFDPSALDRFGRLELVARLVVEGVMAGLHRSPFKGFSVEFAEHRQYGPGDEIRHIDWRAYGKTDRYFVKEFEEQTNLTAYLVVDSSASMGYAGTRAGASKLDQALRLAASLAYLMIGQRDAVGLATTESADDPATMIPPRSTPGHVSILCGALEKVRPHGEAPVSRVLHELAERTRRRGLMIVLSDGFEPLDSLVRAVRHLRHRHHEVLFLHTLAPEEEEFPFHRPVSFRDLERTSGVIPPRGHPDAVRAAYLERFRSFCRELRESLRGMGADYHKASTTEPAERTLIAYLASRSRPGPSGRGTSSGG
jgi:uncharacterized protein (DUF58 family)